MTKYYTGVGSRSTPQDVMGLMTKVATKLESLGYVLRSGAADGSDSAFEDGVQAHSNKEVFIAWNGFSGRSDNEEGVYCLRGEIVTRAEEIAQTLHPVWDLIKEDGTPVVSKGAKSLHTRNVFQVLGSDLNTPSKFLVCWALVDKQGIPKGGTRTSWILATMYNIPCFNLFFEEDRGRIMKFIGEV